MICLILIVIILIISIISYICYVLNKDNFIELFKEKIIYISTWDDDNIKSYLKIHELHEQAKLNIPLTMFVNTRSLLQNPHHINLYKYLINNNNNKIESHSHSHNNIDNEDEYIYSQKIIKNLYGNLHGNVYCYPYGKISNSNVIKNIIKNKYLCARHTDEGFCNYDDIYNLKCIPIEKFNETILKDAIKNKKPIITYGHGITNYGGWNPISEIDYIKHLNLLKKYKNNITFMTLQDYIIKKISEGKIKDTLYKTISIKNIYGKNNILWGDSNDDYVKQNYPNKIDFDYKIKKDIIDNILLLPKNHCIIDCGAHIGDLSIPIACALRDIGREDIYVYAIEPSLEKCNFINYYFILNKLSNLIVINNGLSNIFDKKCSADNKYNSGNIINTGSTKWYNNDSHKIGNKTECIYFTTINDLIINNTIKHRIGLLHLDVEGDEYNVLQGIKNYNTIKYISCEINIIDNKGNIDNNGLKLKTKILDFLKFKNFTNIKRLESNEIFIKNK